MYIVKIYGYLTILLVIDKLYSLYNVDRKIELGLVSNYLRVLNRIKQLSKFISMYTNFHTIMSKILPMKDNKYIKINTLV